jgi:hypothetical protein
VTSLATLGHRVPVTRRDDNSPNAEPGAAATAPRSMKAAFFAFTFLVFCVSATAAGKGNRTTEVIPGRSIGLVQLGDDLRTTEQRYGPATFQDAVMGGRAWEMWRLRRGRSFEVFCLRPDTHIHRVNQIRTTSSRFSTASGLRVGSSLVAVRRAYRSLHLLPDEADQPELHRQGVTVYDAVAIGIAFEFQSDTCTAIMVHEAKDEARTDIFGGHFSYESK